MTEDRRLRVLGTDARIVTSASMADEAERLLCDYDGRVSGSREDSELAALNADPRETVPASALLREAVSVALHAAERTSGLVSPAPRWREVIVDDRRGTISRPPGLRLDATGTSRGHAADMVARLMAYEPVWLVNCGGAVRVGGTDGQPQAVRVAHPLRRGALTVLRLSRGAVATVGFANGADGRCAGHIVRGRRRAGLLRADRGHRSGADGRRC